MNKAKEILLLVLGGLGWLLLGIVCVMLGALDSGTGVWLCVVSLGLGIGLVYFGLDKLMEPRSRR